MSARGRQQALKQPIGDRAGKTPSSSEHRER
jgi:hypothetical protein